MLLVLEHTNLRGLKLSQDQSQLSQDSINHQQEHVHNQVTLTPLDQEHMIVVRSSAKILSQLHLVEEELILHETLTKIQRQVAIILMLLRILPELNNLE